jgi:organic radical activating enzyme
MMVYCDLKWKEFQWVLSSDNISSCCESDLHKNTTTNLPWNSPDLLADREKFLAGDAPASCSSCWSKEAKGLESRRTRQTDPAMFSVAHVPFPERLVINLHNFCNLQCIYCCKEYSSSWFQDIKKMGGYDQTPRYNIFPQDRLRFRISLKDIPQTPVFRQLMAHINDPGFMQVKQVNITGGEPLLNIPVLLQVLDIMTSKNHDLDISINTGLAVPAQNISVLADRYAGKITIHVSEENTGQLAEFNRHNLDWNKFSTNLDLCKANFSIMYKSVLSITTISGFAEFLDHIYPSVPVISFLSDPDFMDLGNFPRCFYSQHITDILSKTNLTSEQRRSFGNLACSSPDKDVMRRMWDFMDRFLHRHPNDVPDGIKNLMENIDNNLKV